MSELEEIVAFKTWLVENDGYFHLDAHFKAGETDIHLDSQVYI
jgi:hypothetical protein